MLRDVQAVPTQRTSGRRLAGFAVTIELLALVAVPVRTSRAFGIDLIHRVCRRVFRTSTGGWGPAGRDRPAPISSPYSRPADRGASVDSIGLENRTCRLSAHLRFDARSSHIQLSGSV